MMIFKERRLLNAEEKEIFCNLQRLCPDHIAVMAKVKLSFCASGANVFKIYWKFI